MLRVLFTIGLLWPLAVSAELQIGRAWIKQLPPSLPVRAGYMTITNPEAAAITIVGAESEAFASVEIHQTVQQGEMMTMRPVDQLIVGSQETVRLEPNGLHLMMMQPKQPTKIGQQILLSLRFADGRRQQVLFSVQK